MKFPIPKSRDEIQDALNRGLDCRHRKQGMGVVETKPAPGKDPGRVIETLFCPVCGGLKKDYVGSNGARRPV